MGLTLLHPNAHAFGYNEEKLSSVKQPKLCSFSYFGNTEPFLINLDNASGES